MAHGEAAQGGFRAALYPLAVLLAAEVTASIAVFTVPVLAPAAAAEMGVAPGLIAIYSALLYLGAMVASLLAGGLVARLGPILLTQASLVAAGLALMLTTAAARPSVFALCGLVIGLAYGQLSPAASQVLARHSPPRHMPLIFSIKQTGNTLGGAIAGVAVAAAAVALAWRGACLGVGLLCILLAAATAPARRRFDDEAGRGERVPLGRIVDPLRHVLARPDLRRVALSGFPYGAMQGCLSAFLVVFLVEELGYPLVSAGTALTASQAAGMVGRVGWGALAGWLGGARVLGLIGVGMAASAAATLPIAAGWPLAAVLCVSAALGATGSGWAGVFASELARLAPAGAAGRAMGGGAFFAFGGSVLAPLGFGAVAEASGSYAVGFAALGLLALAPAAAYLRPGRR